VAGFIILRKMSQEIARLKQKFGEKNHYQPHTVHSTASMPPRATPAYHELRQREQKMKQAAAAKHAKQSAARYNLTLRALELSSVRKVAQDKVRTMEQVQLAKQLASQYNATARALKVGVTGVPPKRHHEVRIQKRISEGFEPEETTPTIEPLNATVKTEASPSATPSSQTAASVTASEDIEAKVEEEDQVKEEESAAETSVAANEVKAKEQESKAAEQADDELNKSIEEKVDIEVSRDATSDHKSFSIPDLENALTRGDDHEINEVLVRTFLEETDPERAKDSSRLLEEFKGREDELMESLLSTSPIADADDNDNLFSSAAEDSEAGFITSATVDKEQSWRVKIVKDAQFEKFRERLKAKGVLDDSVIEKILDNSSEML